MQESIELKLPVWHLDSYKGQQGRVLVVGGSSMYYGAPILASLGAEAAGADLVTMFIPREHLCAAKNYSLNLFLREFVGHSLSMQDVGNIISASDKCDVVVIGNGIGQDSGVVDAVQEILRKLDIPVVLDAEALMPQILDIRGKKQSWLLTPHGREFKRLFESEPTVENIRKMAQKHEITLCVKGMIDYVASPNLFYENRTGVPQMRIGGTGDALAGIIAAYYSMGMDAFNAAKTGVFFWGKCGERMMQKNHTLLAYSMLRYYPAFVSKIIRLATERGESGDFLNAIVTSNLYN